MRSWRRSKGDEPGSGAEAGGPAAGGRPADDERYTEPGGAPLAVITMVRDEGPMLRRWIDHYSRQVGVEHLVVLDDSSSDGSTDDLPCPVVRLPTLTRHFERSRMGLLSGVAAGLLEAYDAVAFTDADEFLVPDPDRWTDLRQFVRAQPEALALGGLGLNVLQAPDEGPLDHDRPVLEQRRYATFVPLMCKPSLKWVRSGWASASHGLRTPYVVHPDLFLFHLKFADREHLRAVADHRRRMVETDGRAARTSWAKSAAEMVDVLDGAAAQVRPDLPEYVAPQGRELEELVIRGSEPGVWRAPKGGQVRAMLDRAPHRIPERFVGQV